MSVVAVADTGPLIYLAEIDELALLSLVDDLYIPQTVVDELEAGGVPDGLSSLDYTIESVDDSADDDSDEMDELLDEPETDRSDLDPGEAAALAVADKRDAVLLTDDLAARTHAENRGIKVHGSIGVIVLGYARGKLERDEAIERMRSLQHETRLFVTNAVVERGIDRLLSLSE